MKPVLQALVLAERVYQDVSGKKIIAGTFNRILVGQKPVREIPDGTNPTLIPGGTDPGCPWVYASLTDVIDGSEIVVQFVNITKNKVEFGTKLKLVSNDRLATVELMLPLPPFSIMAREVGTFSLDIVWQDEILGSHRVIVQAIKDATEEA